MSDDDRPFDGDPTWRVTRTLRDGTPVTLKPLLPEDREEFVRVFRTLSPQTRYFRFLSLAAEPSASMLDALTNVDQINHVAIAATIASPDLKTERGIGVARLVRLSDAPDVAEAAITVVDDVQRNGLGTLFLRELERAARVRNIRRVRAQVLGDNATMRAILEGVGARPVPTGDGAVAYEIEIPPESNTSTSWPLLDVLRGAATTMAMSIRWFRDELSPGRGKDEDER